MNEMTGVLVEYALLALGLSLCTFLFVTVKHDIQRAKRSCDRERAELLQEVRRLQAEIEGIQGRLAETEEKLAGIPRIQPPQPGMNISRRSQILRLHRRGERPEQIAAALGLPQGEVDLLLKLQAASQPALC